MGQRIWFLASTDSGLGTGLPFPLFTKSSVELLIGETIETGPGTFYPISAVPIKNAIRFWALTKEITATVSLDRIFLTEECSISDPIENASQETKYENVVRAAPVVFPDVEKDLLILVEWETAGISGQASSESAVVEVEFELCDGTTGSFTSPPLTPFSWQIGGETDTYNFLPPIMIDDDDPATAFIAFYAQDAYWRSRPWIPSPETFTADLVTPWFTAPLTLYKEPAGNNLTVNEISVELAVTEFREYADSNGDPIYNTTTGERLRNPLG